LQEHSGRCKAVAHTFGKISDAWYNGKTDEAKTNKAKIHSEEKSADHIERELIHEVAKSELPDTKMKEELIYFVRLLDSAAGSAKRSATNMVLLLDHPLPEKYSKLLKEGTDVIAVIFDEIDKAVNSVTNGDPELINSISRSIDKHEDKMDDLYAQFKVGYFEIEKAFNSTAAMIILDHAIRDIEECADRAEDAILEDTYLENLREKN
jgi:predicted phosphate transport protein (TIGR00153 family)